MYISKKINILFHLFCPGYRSVLIETSKVAMVFALCIPEFNIAPTSVFCGSNQNDGTSVW